MAFILKAMDDRRTDIREAFYIGQSVRSNILDVGDLSQTEFWLDI